MRPLTKGQRRRALHAVAWFTVSVNLGALGLNWAGIVEDGLLWTAVVIAANAALIVASRVLRLEPPARQWGPFCVFMVVGAAHAYITINVIKGNYDPDALWIVLLLTGVLVVFGRPAFSPHRRSESDSNSD